MEWVLRQSIMILSKVHYSFTLLRWYLKVRYFSCLLSKRKNGLSFVGDSAKDGARRTRKASTQSRLL